jgi:hypothetical protein
MAMHFEVNMGRTHPVRARGVGAGLDRFDAIDAIVATANAYATDEVWIERRGVGIVGMGVAAEAIGLPDRDANTANRFTMTIENASGDLDNFSLRNTISALDGRQVIGRSAWP